MRKEDFLTVFPGLEAYWELDDGVTAEEVLQKIRKQQESWQLQWETVRDHENVDVMVTTLDLQILPIRLKPFGEDEREELDSVNMAQLNLWMNRSEMNRKPVKRRDFLQTMIILQKGKVNDADNSQLMAQAIFRHLLDRGLSVGSGETFEAEDGTGRVYQGEILGVMEMGGREYAVYKLENDCGGVDILVSRVEQDEDGFDELKDIELETEWLNAVQAVKDLIHTGAFLQ